MALIDLLNLYLGITDNDDKGDSAKSGGQKINENFDKIKTKINSLDEIDIDLIARVINAENSITTLNGQVFINIKGDWNALTNVPNLLTIVKKLGDAYKVSVAGSTDLDGEIDWKINDIAVYGADNKWFKIDNTQFSEINDSIIALNTTYSSTKISESLNTKVDKTTLTEEVQDIMSNTLIDTNEIDFVYNDFDNNIGANIKDVSILNTKIANDANIETSKIKQTTITPVFNIFANGDTQDVINNKTQGQVNNLQDQINSRPVGASSGNTYYLTSQDSAIPNYELLNVSPNPSALDIESITINKNTAKENRLIHSYITNNEIGASIINGGVWGFNLYGYVSHINNSNFEIDVLKRAGEVETLLFKVDTTPFLEIAQVSPENNIVNAETYQQSFSCNTTDKIVIKIYGKTDRPQDTIITLLHSGTDYASHSHTPLIIAHDQIQGAKGGDTTNGRWHLSLTEYNNVQNLTPNLASKQNNIIKVNTQAEMLALSTAIIGDIVIRVDDNNYQYRLNALPASSLSNWEVLGKDAQPVGETVDDIITTNEIITTKPNGLYAFAGVPTGGLPSGIAQGDIALKTPTSYTVAYTFINAPSTIFSKSDSKIYKKIVNGSGVNTWEALLEATIYEVGVDKKYVSFQSAVDSFRLDFLASKVLVGIFKVYDSIVNEAVVFPSDVQNVLVEGFGTQTRGNTQFASITVYGHRITFKNIQVNAFIVNSTGTISEYGITTKRGKHIFDGVVFANNTTAIDVQGINNFLTFKDCDFNGKPIAIANNPSASPLDMTTISIDGCANGTLNCGTNRLITKNNSLSIYQGTITGTIFDVDGAKPIAYSILRSYSALGLSIPIALKTLIINDDVSGTLQLLKCTTAYTIAGSAGVGTAIDLTKYQAQTDNTKENISNKVLSFTATPSDTNYPTEKLVKNNLDLKQNITDNTLTTTNKTIVGGINEIVSSKVSSVETITADNDIAVFSGTTGKVIKKTSASNFKSSLSLSKNDVGLDNVNNTTDLSKPVSTATQTALNLKEDAFTKKTAFNKDFGATTGTICEGNDARLGTKAIDEASIANNKILVYNSTTQKLEYQDKPIGATNLSIANKTSTTFDIASDTGNDATLPSATITEAGLLTATDKVKLNNTSNTNTGDETTATIYTKIKSNIVAGSNVSIATDDVANTVTISSTGSGGGTSSVAIGTVIPYLKDFVPATDKEVDPSTTYNSTAYPVLANIYAGRKLQPVREPTALILHNGGSLMPLDSPDILFAENPDTGVMIYIQWTSYGDKAAIFTPNLAGTDLNAVAYNDINEKIGAVVVGTYDLVSIAFVKYQGTPYFVLAGKHNNVAKTWRISESDLLAGNNWTQGAQVYSYNSHVAPVIVSNNNDVLLAVQYYGTTNYIYRSVDAGISWSGVSLPNSATNVSSCVGYIQKPVWNGSVFFIYFRGRQGSATSVDGLNWINRSTNLYNIFSFDGGSSSINPYSWFSHCIVGGRDWKVIYLTPQPDSYCTGNYYYSASLYSIDNGATFRWCGNSGYPGVSWLGDGFLSGQYSSGSPSTSYNYAYSMDYNTWTSVTIPEAYNPGNYGFIVSRKFKKGYWYNSKATIVVALNATFTTPAVTNSMGSNVVLKIKAKL